MAIVAKYDGIAGEGLDDGHQGWIDIRVVHWGARRDGTSSAGGSRRRGSAEVQDLGLEFSYEKAAVKLLEKCLRGEVIPKLEIEFTGMFDGQMDVYLRYELKKVMISSHRFNAPSDGNDGPPVVHIENAFEEIKVTYTEFNPDGSSNGNVETDFEVEKGR